MHPILCAYVCVCYIYMREYDMRKNIRHSIRTLATTLLLLVVSAIIYAQQPAGITADKATRITAPVTLSVQSGGNFIRLDATHLPAVVTYVSSAPFGTIPAALVMGDTIDAEMVFANCGMSWQWTIVEAENDQIVEIKAHENALINVAPHTCDNTFSDTTAVACDSLLWKGEWRYTSGDYEYVTENAAGCDSIVTLHLTINHPTSSDETETACDSLFWNGEWYKASGDYEYHTTNAVGCDSTAMLHLTIHHSVSVTLPDTVGCIGDFADGYWFIDTLITTPGTYTRHKKTIWGCDSVLTQYVAIAQETYGTDVVTAYDSYQWIDGKTYTKSISGQVEYIANAAGCDSIVTLNLTIRHLQVKDTFVRSLCETELPYEWYGKYYKESGIYCSDTIKGKAEKGVYMDTVHYVDLTILPTSVGDTMATACESFQWYGSTYTKSATPTHTFTNIHGCDSVVTLHLTINQPSASEETKRVCDSYIWNGETYSQSGDYTFRTQNMAGCDSIATLHLTVAHSSSSELTIEQCEHYISPAGKEYTESGTYTETITNMSGCDSTITIYLTILHDCLPPTEYDTVYFCTGFNKEHEERISDVLVRRYLAYTYESPAEWDYMEGVVLSSEHDRTLMDLVRAEANLRNHYVGELTPVERIVWSVRYTDAKAYTPIEAGDQPQWINAGKLAVQILFRCGEMYNNAYPMDVEMVNGEETNGRKIMRNGQIIIIRNGMEYTILGTKIQ